MRIAGSRTGRVLFVSDDDRAVVVNAPTGSVESGPFPAYEVISENWDRDPDPSRIPTSAFTVAEEAFTAADDSDVVVVTASGKRRGKRTYAVPRAVRKRAKCSLDEVDRTDSDLSVGVSIARALSSGRPVGIDVVEHVSRYFETHAVDRSDSGLWGGEAGKAWALKVVGRALAAAADADPSTTALPSPDDLVASDVDDDDEYEEPYDPYDDPYLDPDKPHIFIEGETTPYLCYICGEPENIPNHVSSVEDQVRGQYGDAYWETVKNDEGALSIPSSGAPLYASGTKTMMTDAEIERAERIVLVAGAFYGEHSDDCDYYGEHDPDNDEVSRIFLKIPSGSWKQWEPGTLSWIDGGDADDADLMPLDDDSAYVGAHRLADGAESVPMRDLNPVEWALFDNARPDVESELDDFYAIVPDFYVQTAEDDNTRVEHLYADQGGAWSKWDAAIGEWIPNAAPDEARTETIDVEAALETALWLSSAAGRTSPPDEPDVLLSLRAAGGSSKYTPEERSKNAQQQVRDKFGRFARMGSRAGYQGRTGQIARIDPASKRVLMKFDGPKPNEVWAPANEISVEKSDPKPTAPPRNTAQDAAPRHPKQDGIQVSTDPAKPRALPGTPKAVVERLGLLQPLTRKALYDELDRYQKAVDAWRARQQPTPSYYEPQPPAPGPFDDYFLNKPDQGQRFSRHSRRGRRRGVAASGAHHDGVMVALYLPEELARKYAVENGEHPDDLHVTLAYLGDQDDVPGDAARLSEIVRAWAASTPSITGKIGGRGLFTGGETPVTHLLVDSPSLPAARQSLVNRLSDSGVHTRSDHGFIPHVTLAYDDVPVESDNDDLTFDHVVVSYGDHDEVIPLGAVRAAATSAAPLTPTTSDVPPLYLAVVDKLDKSAVMDLLALVPASSKSSVPILYKRAAGGWVKDDNYLRKLRSAAPPPVITLDKPTYEQVLAQVDQYFNNAQKSTAASGQIEMYSEYGELLPAGPLILTTSTARTLRRLGLPVTPEAFTATRHAVLSASRTPVNVAGIGQIVPVLAHGRVSGLSPSALSSLIASAVPTLAASGGRVSPIVSAASTATLGFPGVHSTLAVDGVGYRLQMVDADAVPNSAQVIDFAVLRYGSVDGLPRRNVREATGASGTDSGVPESVEFSGPQTASAEVGAELRDRSVAGVQVHLLREAESVTGFDYGDSWHVTQNSIFAAGGLDRNRGQAENLRRYWTVGPGGAKIRWGQGGDWYRCVRHLSKYLGPRAKGYCFSGDTEFTTRDGVMTFEEAVGTTQFVLTDKSPVGKRTEPVSDSGYWVEAPIVSFGEQRLLTVTLTRGGVTRVIRATPEHRWFVSPNGRNLRRFDVDTVTTAELLPGMVLASIWARKQADLAPSPDGVRAGFVFGDGSRVSTNTVRVDVWGEKQDDILPYFSGYQMTPKKLDTGVLGTRVSRISGAHLKNLPDLGSDLSYLYGWLAGYIAADGTVPSSASLVLHSKHREHLAVAKHIATMLGIKTGVIGSTTRRGYLDHDAPLYRLSFLVNDIPDGLVIRKKHREALNRELMRAEQTGVRWRVVSVEDRGEAEEVFCAVVPETESFALTEGMWVQNCNLRHKEMLGMYPATHAKILRGSASDLTEEELSVINAEAEYNIEFALDLGAVAAAATVADVRSGGSRFRIPIVVPEGVETGDGRIFKPLSVTHRDLPVPLLWQMKTGDGHDGSVVVGRVDHIERVSNGLGNAYGVFDTSPHAQEVERMVREGFLRGVSADLDKFSAEEQESETLESDDADDADKKKIGGDKIMISAARVMGVTVVPKPAFQECIIELLDDEEPPMVADGLYAAPGEDPLVACALLASSIPVVPPDSWFERPSLQGPTPLTVTDDGQVFGHIAAWHVDHIGLPFGTKPPKSRSDYAYFHTGVVRTDSGRDVPCGQLTLAGGHAPLDLTADAAVRHYDDTHSAVADVHAGEDMFGIWVAGALRPGTTAEQIRTLRASAPSGDWRPIGGRLELVAVCQVNVPGFPITRARVASGYVTALVAAGTAPLLEMMHLSADDRMRAVEAQTRVAAVRAERDAELQAKVASVRTRVYGDLSAKKAELQARVHGASLTDLADYSDETRKKYASKGWALKDGAYPIANVADLKNAIRAYGRSSKSDRAKVRRHIMRRARGLGRTDLIPSSWTSASIEERAADARALFAEIRSQTASGAVLHFAADEQFREELHPRDDSGRFRKVLFRLRDTLHETPVGESADRDIEEAVDAMDNGEIDQVKLAGERVMEAVDEALRDVDPTQITDVQNLKAGYAALGEVLARLPLAQGSESVTYRWTDLPPDLSGMIDDIMDRLRDHVDSATYEEVTAPVVDYQSGTDYVTSDQLQSWMTEMLRYLLE